MHLRRQLIAQDDDGRIRLTPRGRRCSTTTAPLGVLVGFTSLIIDLLRLDPTAALLSQWRPLDHLWVVALCASPPQARPPSRALSKTLETWLNACSPSQRSALIPRFGLQESDCHALLGSLQRPVRSAKQALRSAQAALLHAAILWTWTQGETEQYIQRRFRLSRPLPEPRWRYDAAWYLRGFRGVCHLDALEEGSFNPDQSQLLALEILPMIRMQAWRLSEDLSRDRGAPRGRPSHVPA